MLLLEGKYEPVGTLRIVFTCMRMQCIVLLFVRVLASDVYEPDVGD